MEETRYCFRCGAEVPYHIVTTFDRRECICVHCGFVLYVDELQIIME